MNCWNITWLLFVRFDSLWICGFWAVRASAPLFWRRWAACVSVCECSCLASMARRTCVGTSCVCACCLCGCRTRLLAVYCLPRVTFIRSQDPWDMSLSHWGVSFLPRLRDFTVHRPLSAITHFTLILLKKYFLYLCWYRVCPRVSIYKTKLHGLSQRANYTDRATAACRQSDCQLLRINGATWSAWQIPTAVFSVF
jgi:hypothetical protein